MPQSVTPSTPFIPALPAIIEQLPDDTARPQQSQFTRDRQAGFLKRLADTGEVRVAARAASISHQTVYRLRRSCSVFRLGMDAALVIARELAEDMLASRAMNGVEEDVLYHGEVVATRRRYDSRLLLAHLARLDRKAEGADAARLAGSFDAVIAAFEAADAACDGDDHVNVDENGDEDAGGGAEVGLANTETAPVVLPQMATREGGETAPQQSREMQGAAAPLLSSGPCNMRSMSPGGAGELDARLEAMEAARPADALRPAQQAPSLEATGALEWAQLLAFEAGEERWWEVNAQGHAETGPMGPA